MKSIGYLGAPASHGNSSIMPDWTHINGVDFNADLDQIVLTVRAFSEFWIIDHSTTTAEAKGHTGGLVGKGGDLLYRWGNPQAYAAGTKQDQQLFSPHGAHWIPRNCPARGHILVFNNGLGRPDGDYSSVDEVILPRSTLPGYPLRPGAAYEPDQPAWSFTAPQKTDFSARLLSSAQRLPNGNTLICNGETGAMFEVTPDKKTVWEQRAASIITVEPRKPISPPARKQDLSHAHEILSSEQRGALKMSPGQNKDLDALQNEVAGKLEKTLTEGQRSRLETMNGPGSGGFGGFAAPGQIMSLSRQILLKPTDDQKKELAELQKRVDNELAAILTVEQKAQFEAMKIDFARGGSPTSVRNANSRAAGAPGDFAGALPPGVSPVFRVLRYAADYPGLSARICVRFRSDSRRAEPNG